MGARSVVARLSRSVLFLSYGFANWWTSRLATVGVVVFPWEKTIPFLEWTILPYMSIDAFYALSLFMCSTRVELDTHAKRLLSATLISVAGFLLFPLKFSFIRPPVTGFNGVLFDALSGLDKPFNQAPSLHISLLLLLWLVYARHLNGFLRWLMHGWFFLIGLSVFTTYQHHVIDGIAGLAVGIICIYLFPDQPNGWRIILPDSTPARQRIFFVYAASSVVCLMLASMIGGWAWLLLWVFLALGLVAIAYWCAGVQIFQKTAQGTSWPARLIFGPYRLGAWLSSRFFTRFAIPSVEIADGVWIGRAPSRRDWAYLDAAGVLDLNAEFVATARSKRGQYRCVPMLDLVTPSLTQLQQAIAALDELHAHPPVLVHCALGYSRSALVMAAWLLHKRLAQDPEQAIEMIAMRRPHIVMPPDFCRTLDNFYHA